MAYTLKDKLFGFFGSFAKATDTYKDVNGKGINERYQEALGEDYDENIRLLVDDFHDNVYVPSKILSKLIKYYEANIGFPVIIYPTDSFRRKMIRYNNNITLIKGTILSYQILYSMLGISLASVTLIDQDYGFDSSFTLDDDNRRFDGRYSCQKYSIELTGLLTQDATLEKSILRIALYLKAIDSNLVSITYNSNPVPLI